jgi:hypothetical protein
MRELSAVCIVRIDCEREGKYILGWRQEEKVKGSFMRNSCPSQLCENNQELNFQSVLKNIVLCI